MKKLEEKYNPIGPLGRLSPQLPELCRRRIELARGAMEFLQNTEQRMSHRASVIPEYQLKTSAELLFKQAEIYILRNELKRARELLQTAIELDPKEQYIAKIQTIGG
jgi:hypothetical protein